MTPRTPAVSISDVQVAENQRIPVGIAELDRVLGGGVVPGSVILVGGDPGIGKSTLLTQVVHRLASAGTDTLYLSGEESIRQVRLRCERLGALTGALKVAHETDLSAVLSHLDAVGPAVAVVDSIQTCCDPSLEAAPGTVSQVRECATALVKAAKELSCSLFLIGHVTKEGALAGPKLLEHMVDAVLTFEGDRHYSYRILRAVKNRFGATDEIGVFEMAEAGLREIPNPSAAMLSERTGSASGSIVTAVMEGSRALLVEVQALAARSFLASPRRTATGVELNRLHMLLAVLEKRMGLRLAEQDVFVNAAGGMRISEPAADLAIALAVAGSFRDQGVCPQMVCIGEVGLGGEIRSIPQLERRLREALRMGFTHALVPAGQAAAFEIEGMTILPAADIGQAVQRALLRPEREN
jgi:DNA repair protein RadA/Sms